MSYTSDDYIRDRRKNDTEFDKEIMRQEIAFPIAMQIIKLRDKAGLTQKQLAELVGTKQSAIARLENGESIPTIQTLYKISTALNQTMTVSFEAKSMTN